MKEMDPDIVYIRSFPLDWLFGGRRAAEGHATVLELNTMLRAEYASRAHSLRGSVYEKAHSRMLRCSVSWLGVTEEILEDASRVSGARPFTAVVPNGFEPNRVGPLVVEDVDPFQILMLGAARPWHGADRAIDMLRHLPMRFRLQLVGFESPDEMAPLSRLASDLGVIGRVEMLPWTSGGDSQALLRRAGVGLGPLALERKGMKQAQPIKCRAYLAHGIPVFFSHVDPFVPAELPFVATPLAHSTQEWAASIEKLSALSAGDRLSARDWAFENLTWDSAAAATLRALSHVDVERSEDGLQAQPPRKGVVPREQ